MARAFLVPIDLSKNELQNPRAQNLASDPGTPVEGQFYWNTATKKWMVYNGTSFVEPGSSSGIPATIVDVKGDLIVASAADTVVRLAAGADDTILMADAAAASGLKWVASATPVAVTPDATAAAGTSDDFSRASHQHGLVTGTATPAAVSTAGAAGTSGHAPSRDDHVHPHEAAHINHDTTWAAKGDLIAATANDAASVLTVGADGTFLVAASGQTTGLQWRTIATADLQEKIATADLTDWPRVADLDLASHKLTSVTDPTNPQDAATKAYVDATAAGIDWKRSVRAATTAAGTLATSFENADVIDGVTLATGDRILIKDQAAGAENGIYTVNATGAPTRATDADSAAEVTSGMAVFVEEGTANADTGWVMTNNGAITLGTTALVFAQFTALGQITAGAGLTKTGSTLDVIAGSTPGSGGPGGGLKVNADDVVIDTAIVVRKFATDVGNGSLTSITVTHNLGTLDVTVEVFANSGGAKVECDVTHATTNTLTLVFAVAPTSNQYRCVVHG